jgi:carboxyl-terminal processing protease
VTQEDGAIKVIAPTADTPADKAGIKAGDYITHLDGELIVGGTVDDAVNRMRGTPGTQSS